MIPGTTSSQLLLAAAGEDADGMIGLLDFVNDSYTLNGATLDYNVIVGDDPALVVSGRGKKITLDEAFLMNVVLTFLQTCNWTLVVEVEMIALPFRTMFVNFDFNDGQSEIDVYVGSSGDIVYYEAYDSGATERFMYDENMVYVESSDSDVVYSRTAFTRDDTHSAMSTNGSPVVDGETFDGTDIAGQTIGDAKFCFYSGSAPGNLAGYIRRIEIYEKQPDSLLPTLSTVV